MNDLVEIELDLRALEYVKDLLTNIAGIARWEKKQEKKPDGTIVVTDVPYDVRTDSLAHRLLKRQDLVKGKVIACIPRRTPQEALYHFREGVHLKAELNKIIGSKGRTQEMRSVPEEDTYYWLLRVVMEYLGDEPDKVCMFDSWTKSPDDPALAKLDLPPHIFQNQVYFALFHKDANKKEIVSSIIGHATEPFFFGVMSSFPAGSGLDPKGGEITDDVLEVLAQRTEKIVVGAYDGESYLIWSKPGTWMDARAVSAK